MSKLKWDQIGERLYETGVDKVVLFPMESTGQYGDGVAWNGITAVNESPSGAEPTALYANNGKYLNLISNEDFAATIEAYTYPDEFEECDGSKEIAPGVVIGQQKRKVFGLAYRTLLGNDVDGYDHGYKLHLVYGCLAAPSENNHSTVNDSPEAGTMSWSVSTTPVEVADAKPTATVTIDSTKADKAKLKKLEDMLYGTEQAESKLPLPAEVITLMKDAAA
nr:MAG TPA: tail tube protein [Caudoviricetes sp.]